MAGVKEHYDKFLAPYYSWISGGLELNLEENRKLFHAQGIRPKGSKVAMDLGAGSGFQSIPLAELGFKVMAIDMSHHLLAELKKNAQDLPIVTIEDQLLNFTRHSSAKFEVIVCMGDTLTHLNNLEEAQSLFENAYQALEEQGLLILSFRDLTVELTDLDRFIPVSSDSKRIFTCFLEYENTHVKVHDIIYEKINTQWKLRKSFFRKLRISPQWTKEILLRIGFKLETCDIQSGMATIITRKP